MKFFVLLLIGLSIQQGHASNYCKISWSEVKDHKGNFRNEEALFKSLKTNPDCEEEKIILGGFYSREVLRIQFEAVTGWRGGRSGSYLFQCTKTTKHGPNSVEELGLNCLQLTN